MCSCPPHLMNKRDEQKYQSQATKGTFAKEILKRSLFLFIFLWMRSKMPTHRGARVYDSSTDKTNRALLFDESPIGPSPLRSIRDTFQGSIKLGSVFRNCKGEETSTQNRKTSPRVTVVSTMLLFPRYYTTQAKTKGKNLQNTISKAQVSLNFGLYFFFSRPCHI